MKVYIGNITGSTYAINADSDNETLTATAKTIADNTRTAQIISSFGLLSSPPSGAKGVFVDQGSGMLCIGATEESIEAGASLSEGDVFLYSYSGGLKSTFKIAADGTATLEAAGDITIDSKNDLIDIKNDLKGLKALIEALADAIKNGVILIGSGSSSGSWPFDPTTIANIETAKLDFSNLLKS